MPTPAIAPPGLETWLWKRLPKATLWSLGGPWLLVALRRWLSSAGFVPAAEAELLRWDFAALGWNLFAASLLVAVATGCWVVRVMKGPQRVADSYPPPDRSSPLKPGPDRPSD